jgi:adenylate cyclase
MIVSENTSAAAPDFAYRELDRVRFKGKDEPVTTFEPLDRDENLDEETRERLERFHQALHHYRQQQWDQAEAALRDLQEDEPERMIYEIYIERIRLFREDPPPAD